MEEKIQKQAAHEYRSAAILEKLLDESKFWDSDPKPPLSKEKDLEFIKHLITFSKDYEEEKDDDKTVEKKKKDDFVEVYLINYIEVYTYVSDYFTCKI